MRRTAGWSQTEGPSDISEVPQPERMFWGARH